MSKIDILRVPDYLEHIFEAIERIHLYIEDISEVAFLEDKKTQDAVIRNFEIIGEAAHNIERYHAQFAAEHTDVLWTVLYAMRNRVSHGYFKVDLEIVWKTIHSDLPELHAQIRKLLDQISKASS
ncbi:MAG: hypothetical protein A2X98_10410 [Deltaproteobacteria bacterium GWC2_66_88]|nr:MAG: hypothetical protein A2X98_10410 [Deltaproteobacteria bacterium GWC2_66_88]